MNRYFIKLAYNGNRYHGWQVQNNATGIQEVINKGLSYHVNKSINVVGCGRTDTGVHARQFYAHFDVSQTYSADELRGLVFKVNRFLPSDIAIYDIFPVSSGAHARFDALSRTYEYYIALEKDPFLEEFSWLFYGGIDVKAMNNAAEKLYEYEDFTSFSKLHTQVKSNNCRIEHAKWEQRDHLLIFSIRADRFLRNMVRAIVGTLLEVGTRKKTIDEFIEVIESKSRSEAGLSVPAKGLFLTRIEYPETITSMLKANRQ